MKSAGSGVLECLIDNVGQRLEVCDDVGGHTPASAVVGTVEDEDYFRWSKAGIVLISTFYCLRILGFIEEGVIDRGSACTSCRCHRDRDHYDRPCEAIAAGLDVVEEWESGGGSEEYRCAPQAVS